MSRIRMLRKTAIEISTLCSVPQCAEQQRERDTRETVSAETVAEIFYSPSVVQGYVERPLVVCMRREEL